MGPSEMVVGIEPEASETGSLPPRVLGGCTVPSWRFPEDFPGGPYGAVGCLILNEAKDKAPCFGSPRQPGRHAAENCLETTADVVRRADPHHFTE